ncbi:putative inorganic phosphate cotransporter [Musca vetustissima]|uniref:putative inorganic phosphate cotransporter n=1 Tax=Musca vetustissima TaxID=27455 RepID=UPI002AB63EC5|nr:putative inorganic phosphate cotransporter [Musca vetustissima]
MTAEIPKGPVLGQRHLQVFLLFLSITVNYIAKFNAGVAVVAMTNAETTNPDFPEYDWNEMEKSYILSSFFWGYFVTQFPGGYFCRRFGAKLTMFISTLGSALAALLIPLTVDWGGWQVYCGIRVVQGLFQGLLFPSIHAHLAAWCPVSERNRLGALANTGIECGTVLSMFLSGIIAASSMGWPGISYISCAIGVIWCILWIILAANSPSESKFISEAECSYIENSKNALKDVNAGETPKKIPVPWAAIMTSMPFWALLVARSAQSWGFSTLQAEIPSYMNGVLGMDMKSNALFSALPYFAMWCMSYIYLITSDVLLQKKILSLSAIRKTFNSLAFWVPAIGLIAVGFVGESQQTLAIVLMTANVGINAGSTIGSALNTIDLSPNHAGILMGIVNTSANIIPILTPLLVGLIVKNEDDRTEWQIVFAISAIVFGLGNLFYIVFGSTKLQPWDNENFLLSKDIQNEDCVDKKSDEKKEKLALTKMDRFTICHLIKMIKP